LPLVQENEGVAWSPPAPKPQSEHITKTIREGVEEKSLTHESGRDILTIRGDHGVVEFVNHGLNVGSELQEVWSIDHDDVTSAHADITWDRSMRREDFAVSTKVKMTMHCDVDAFYVTAHIKAFEGEHCVFEREFHDKVGRDPEFITLPTTNN